MGKKIKIWWQKAGFTNVLVLIIGIALIFLVPWRIVEVTLTMADIVGLCLVFFAIGVNWQALKDHTDLDERFNEKWDELKDTVRERLEELKADAKENLIDETQGIGGQNPPDDDEEGGTN